MGKGSTRVGKGSTCLWVEGHMGKGMSKGSIWVKGQHVTLVWVKGQCVTLVYMGKGSTCHLCALMKSRDVTLVCHLYG